jgi:hypothetical protein
VRTRTPAATCSRTAARSRARSSPAFLRLEPDRLERLKQLEAIRDFWQRGVVSELIDLGTAREWFHNGTRA